MIGKTFGPGVLCRLAMALALALCLISIRPAPATALSVDDYFKIDYSVQFSSTDVQEGEIFYATITGTASCVKDLPLSVSEARVTGRVTAENTATGAKAVLSSDYTLSISPFPNKAGEVAQASQTVALEFPTGSNPGSYNVSGELVEARVKAVLWFTVTSYLPQYQSLGQVTYRQVTAQPIPTGTTAIAGKIDWQGTITQEITAASEDSRCTLTLYEGTKALDEYGSPLQEIRIVDIKEPQAPPENCGIIGPVYDIDPDGATFDPPAVLTLTYDETQIPEGVSQEKLAIASWDEVDSQWHELELSVVDPTADTITAPVHHLTTFAVIAHTAPPAFTISGLSVSPTEARVGDTVTVTALVENTGDLPGSYELALMLNNDAEETRSITLEGGASSLVTFNLSPETADFYLLNLNGLTGSFVVKREAIPAPTPSLTSTPTAAPTGMTSPGTTNWWLVGGIYATDLALLITVLHLIRRPSHKDMT